VGLLPPLNLLHLQLELARMGKYTTKSCEERYRKWLERMGGVYGETHAMFLRRWVRFGGIGRVDLGRACQADFDRVIHAILAVADGNEDSGINTGLVLWLPALMLAIFLRLEEAPSTVSCPKNASTRPSRVS
jgi:hypothetical protein